MKAWLAVASAEHVRAGGLLGFLRVCQGKAGPLRRMKPDDPIVHFSPMEQDCSADRLQAFIALGRVRDGEPFAFDMGGGFLPWRRGVDWSRARANASNLEDPVLFS